MVINKRKVRSDILLYTASQLLYKIVGYGVLMMLTRHLSQERMGEFFFCASLASVTVLFAEIGSTSYLTRALAAEPGERERLFAEIFSFQTVSTVVLLALLNLVLGLTKPHLAGVLALTSVYILFEQLYLVFGAMFVGLHRVSYNIISGVSAKLFLIVLVAIAVHLEFPLNGILVCYIAANGLLLATAVLLSRRLLRGFRFTWDPKRIRAMLGSAISFFFVGVLGLVHFSADTLMLGYLSTLVAVATYETAFKLLEAARFVSRAFYTIYFPVLSALVKHEKWGEVRSQFLKLLGLAAAGGVAVSVVVVSLASWIIPFVFGPEYDDSIPVLRILYVCLPVFYLSQIGSLLLNASGFERVNAGIWAGAVVFNILLNLYAIPNHGPIGAAWATVASHSALAVCLAAVGFRGIAQQAAAARTGG